MNNSIHHRIRTLIEDTSELFFNHHDSMNTDFAEYASLAVAEFRAVLSEPGLTRSQLTSILRSGMGKSREEGADNWPHFLAYHVAASTNGNMVE